MKKILNSPRLKLYPRSILLDIAIREIDHDYSLAIASGDGTHVKRFELDKLSKTGEEMTWGPFRVTKQENK